MTNTRKNLGRTALALLLCLYLFPVLTTQVPAFTGHHPSLDPETPLLGSACPDLATGATHISQRAKSGPADVFGKTAALSNRITADSARTSRTLPRTPGERLARPTGQAPAAIRAPPFLLG